MTEYDSDIAAHYAAYRPALHAVTLHAALGETRFDHGLDVGCGAGASSEALAGWCDRVTGTDASAAMLAEAKAHPGVRYRAMEGGTWPVAAGDVDVVTFAGVVSYLNRAATLLELARVCRPGAVVLSYDFAVDLGPVLEALGVEVVPSGYDHAASFDGCQGLRVDEARQWSVDLPVTADEAAHLVLAGRRAHGMLVAQHGRADVFEAVRDSVASDTLAAQLYFTRHRLG